MSRLIHFLRVWVAAAMFAGDHQICIFFLEALNSLLHRLPMCFADTPVFLSLIFAQPNSTNHQQQTARKLSDSPTAEDSFYLIFNFFRAHQSFLFSDVILVFFGSHSHCHSRTIVEVAQHHPTDRRTIEIEAFADAKKRRRAEKLKRKKNQCWAKEMRWSEKTRLEWIFMCLLHDYMTKPIKANGSKRLINRNIFLLRLASLSLSSPSLRQLISVFFSNELEAFDGFPMNHESKV